MPEAVARPLYRYSASVVVSISGDLLHSDCTGSCPTRLIGGPVDQAPRDALVRRTKSQSMGRLGAKAVVIEP